MSSFEAKTVWTRPRKRENKNYRFVTILPGADQKMRKKKAKKLKILKNTIVASFEAKIVWKRPRKRENKNYCFVPILSGAEQKMPKKKQKNLKNTTMASIQAKIC